MEMVRRVTTQDISWFLDLYRNEQLDLDPPYQRRSVWSPRDRRFFLDTIFRGYPSPSIFLHKVLESGKTLYYVVDGKQRLETIFRFINSKIAIDKDFGDSRLNGKKWKDIENVPELAHAFWDYVLPVEFINVSDSSDVNEVFDRLNRNSRKLVEQELRHAKYDGWFISFVERESEELDWRDLGVVTTARARRMKDVQFLSELLIVLLKGSVSGFDQNEIDDFYAKYDDPADSGIEFNEDEVNTNFIQGRRYLIEMEKQGKTITKYATDLKNLYSLWCVIILKKEIMPDSIIFAEKYSKFMDEVNLFKDKDRELMSDIELQFPTSFRYYQNSIGANTEEPQRINRLESLVEALLV